MQRPPVARTLGLSKSFAAREAISGIDITIPPGVAFGLLGPNGAGKTTLIRCLLGLLRPTSGSVELMGHRVPQQHAAALERVGAVVEEPRFYDHLSGWDNLRVVAALLDESALRRIPSVLDRVGLADRAFDRVGSYSLGMKQRLGIARCLLNDPLLLVLDEPMNGLDPAGIQEFRILVRRLVGEGRSVLISSHLLDEIEKTCDVVGIIDRGRLVRQSTLRELRHTSQNQVRVGCDDTAVARKVMQRLAWVSTVGSDDSGQLIVTLAADASPASLNRELVMGGVGVSFLAAAEVTLEERFLDLTTRLQSSEVHA
ncbi:MAG: ABC transporter ATP-binding protein [Chloroflexi bacterium]|nr:ABC transporter ATP-binding protein [Chloroflexota bacterium]